MSIEKFTLGELCTIEKGITGILKAIPGKYPLVVTSEERKSHNEFQFDGDAVIIPLVSGTGHGHASIKRIHFQTGKFALGSILCAVIPKDKLKLNAEYLYYFLDLNRENELVARMRGMANVTLSMKEIAKIEIPLPSIDEQIAFVKMYKFLGDKSNDLSLELSHQLKLVKKLRQQLLQDAIQGKLVKQKANDEPATILLKKITTQKEQLIKDKKLKSGNSTEQSLSLIDDERIPGTWKWCKSDDIFFVTKLAGFEYSEHMKFEKTGQIPVIRAQNVRPLVIEKSNLLYISKDISTLLERCALTKSCLLITFIGAGIGDVATFNEKERWHLAPNVAKMEPFLGCETLLNIKYINYFFLSDIGQRELFKHIKVTAQPSLSMSTIRDIDIPIPPIEEQHRIVKKLEQLLQTCNSLEVSIKQSQQQNEQLLQQVLREALTKKVESKEVI